MGNFIEQREYNYSEIIKKLFELSTKYKFLSVYSIGKTVLGRPIYAAKIGITNYNVLYFGGIHGSERLTTLTLMMFLEKFCKALHENTNFSISNARNALFGKSIIIIPCANPDGYEIALNGVSTAGAMADKILELAASTDLIYWNANARGVDLNHNFNAGFDKIKQLELQQGITSPGPRKYGGTEPESEPESKALVEICKSNYIAQAIALHSQGEEIYWQYGDNTPKKAFRLARLYATSSGYAISQPEFTASHGGFKDWFIQEYGRPGFTLEIGLGTNPLSPSMLYDIYNDIEELFLLSIALS